MRCYDGCPDDELAAVWKSRADARAEARRLGYHIAYYPVECDYAAARMSDWTLVGPRCDTVEECLTHVKKHYKEAQEAAAHD